MSPKLHFREYSPDQLTLFPQRIDEHISQNDPVRLVSSVIDKLDLSEREFDIKNNKKSL